jgi:predicted negative regulator of RcsB-dependent stress response
MPPTDKAPGHAPGVQRTVVEGAQPYIPPPPAKTGGGAGKWIALVLVLGFLGVVVIGGGLTIAFWDKITGSTQTAGTDPATPSTPSNGTKAPSTPADPGNDEAYKRYQKGVQLQQSGDTKGAIAEYRAAIAQRGQFPQAHANLGGALLDAGQYDEARRELTTAIQQDPSPKAEYYFNLGMVCYKLEDYTAAADAFKRSTDIKADPLAYAYRGFVLDNAGDREGARTEYQAADPTGEAAPVVRDILAGRAKAPKGSEV